MPLSAAWPSLADEFELSEALFGSRGPQLVSTWFAGEMARVDDMDFARLFSDHIDLPGVVGEDYLHRRIRTSSGTLLGGIRFYGRDITRPFVEVIAHSFDDLDRLRDCVSREWSTFSPPALRLTVRPGKLDGPNVALDHSVYAARFLEMRPPTAGVSLEPFARVEDAEALMHARYDRMAFDDPALARNVSRASDADLRTWHADGCLRAVRTADAVVGLLAILPGRVRWIVGAEVHEEVIAADHRGHGYATSAQAAWAAHVARDPSELLVGTIDVLNAASRKSAERAGRRRVLDTVFVALAMSK